MKEAFKLPKEFYWIEASDTVAYWQERYAAFKIPAIYAPVILGTDNIKINPNDSYQYTHALGTSIQKVIFGFGSIEQINALLDDGKYQQHVNHIKQILFGHNTEFGHINAIYNAIYFIEDCYNLYRFRTMTPALIKAFEDVIHSIKNLLQGEQLSADQIEFFQANAQFMQEIINEADIIIPHKFFQ